MRYSNKAIILLEDKFLQNRVETILSDQNIVPSEIAELSNLESVRLKLRQNGTLAFIQEEIISLSKTDAPPFIIIMSYHNTIHNTKHEDRTELFRLVISAFMLLSLSRDFENLNISFMIPYRHYDHDLIRKLKADHSLFFSGMKYHDEPMKSVIEAFRSDKKRFDSLFTLNFIETDGNTEHINTKMKLYFKSIEKRISFEVKKEIESAPVIKKNNNLKADVVFKKKDGKIILNGEMKNDSGIYDDLNDSQITIIGEWGSSNLLDINDKIIMTVGTLLENRIITYKDELKIYLRDNCRIDNSIAISTANLMNKLFNRFAGAYLCATGPNEKILSSSPGYSLLKTHIKRIN